MKTAFSPTNTITENKTLQQNNPKQFNSETVYIINQAIMNETIDIYMQEEHKFLQQHIVKEQS